MYITFDTYIMQLSFAPTAPVAWILTLKFLISKALLNTLRDQISGKHLLKDLAGSSYLKLR